MTALQRGCLGLSIVSACVLLACQHASAETAQEAVIRLAELEIDPAQLEAYKLALKEEIETSIRVEPGVLTLYAVSVKGHPNQVRLFERYRNVAAYQSHLQTSHFKNYKTLTQNMVKSLNLIETDPILLGAKKQVKASLCRVPTKPGAPPSRS
jgi:quinol monooxygenase YgiN